MGKVERFESNLREFEGFRLKYYIANQKVGFVMKSKYKKVGVQPNDSTNMESKIEKRVFTTSRFSLTKGLRSKTLNFTFHSDSTRTFLYFDLYLSTAFVIVYQWTTVL